MLARLSFLTLFLVSSAYADLFVEVPGCYLFQGEIVEISSGKAQLKIFAGSESEEILDISFGGDGSKLLKGSTVELSVLVSEKGAITRVPLSSDVANVHPIAIHEINPRKVGQWKGKAKKGTCPR